MTQAVKNISKNSRTKKRWKTVTTLIVDEVSMVDAAFFDLLEGVARSFRDKSKPFGGIQLVLSGDFLQLPREWLRRCLSFVRQLFGLSELCSCFVCSGGKRQKGQPGSNDFGSLFWFECIWALDL